MSVHPETKHNIGVRASTSPYKWCNNCRSLYSTQALATPRTHDTNKVTSLYKLVFYTIIKRSKWTVNHNIVVTKGPLKYSVGMASNEILPLSISIFYDAVIPSELIKIYHSSTTSYNSCNVSQFMQPFQNEIISPNSQNLFEIMLLPKPC